MDQKFPRALRALIVDDHEISRQFTVAALRQAAAAVKHTGCALQALDLVNNWWPDVIFLDLQLAEMSGSQLAIRIRRSWPGNRSQPRIVALSANLQVLEEHDQSGMVFDLALQKPASPGVLLDALAPGATYLVREERGPVGAQLKHAFCEELAQRLPELDDCMASYDLDGAGKLLHQLTASSALCGATRLESRVRALSRSCAGSGGPEELARDYYALDLAAREYLARTHPARKDSLAEFGENGADQLP